MALHAIESQRFGLEFESTRGTVETAPAKWFPTRGPVEFNYSLQHLEDTGIRGILAKYAPVQGIKVGEFKIPMILDSQTCAEMFYSLLGGLSSAQQGGTAAYKHTITRSGILPPSYTFFVDRSLNVLKYNFGCVKKITLKGGVSDLVEMDVEGLFKTEASGSIGSPSFPSQKYLSFQHASISIAGSGNTDVKEFNLSIDNGARALRVLDASQDLNNILAPEKLMVEGGFTIYFQSATERDKFIANTASSFTLSIVGQNIASTFYHTVLITLYSIYYKAFPYGEDQGLLAAKVNFEGYYSTSDSKAIQVDVTNTDTAPLST